MLFKKNILVEESAEIKESRKDTQMHILKVQMNIEDVIENLSNRAEVHDKSKLVSPELEVFAEYGPKLKSSTYMSDEYKENLKGMKPALDHHYANNDHHPEYHPNGIDDMSLFSIIEMFCDWKAASERHDDGDMKESIKQNAKRFNMSPQLVNIFNNTLKEFEETKK